jgi:hypothetical protein
MALNGKTGQALKTCKSCSAEHLEKIARMIAGASTWSSHAVKRFTGSDREF